jgi:hypothetical protein
MTSPYPFLLVVVDGPSEAMDRASGVEPSGVVRKIIARAFGDDVARSIDVLYWHRLRRSPLRAARGHAEKARHLAVLANGTTAYGAVMLLDNDHKDEGGRSVRLEELRAGVGQSGVAHRTAVGIAREMIEAWMLADPHLLAAPLPAGKRCEELWGSRDDAASNYPKHVLRRCVLEPRGLSHMEAVDAWSAERARPNASSLDDFMKEVDRLASSQGVV